MTDTAPSRSSRRRVGATLFTAAALVSLVVAAALPSAAGAASSTPYNTATTITSTMKSLVTGQSVTFTASVRVLKVIHPPVPQGQVAFTITGTDSSTVTCDAGNTPVLSGGTATCTVSGGLLTSIAPYSVTAAYTDTVDAVDNPSTGTYSQVVNPGATVTTETASSNPSVTGQPVVFTAAVAPKSPAVGSLSGSVTFANVTCDGGNTVPVVGGLAQCSVSGGLLASQSPLSVTASYGSDPEFAPSTGTVKQTIAPAAATLSLAATPDTCTGDICSVSEGTPVSFTVTAASTAPGTGTPTGSVTFAVVTAGKKHYQTCQGGNTVALSAGQATCSFPNGLPADLYYQVTATLSDPNYSAPSATLYETDGQLSTNVAVAVPKNITAGESFAVVATVTPVGGGSTPPTGSVDITVCGFNSNGGSGCQGGPAAVSANGTASFTIGGGEYVGVYQAYASYLGDQNYFGSTSKKKQFEVDKSGTSIVITSSENPSFDGDPVAFTATLTAANGSGGSSLVGPPSGSITFTITDADNNTYTCQDGNVVPLNNGQADEGVATCYLPAGVLTDPGAPGSDADYTVRANYPTDGQYGTSGDVITQTVVPALD
jgi:hypothetical protein